MDDYDEFGNYIGGALSDSEEEQEEEQQQEERPLRAYDEEAEDVEELEGMEVDGEW